MSAVRFDPQVLAVSAYAPDPPGLDRSKYLCLDQNESGGPPPQRVAEAIAAQVQDRGLHAYPEDRVVYPALAEYARVPEDHLLVTNGSDQAIDITLRAFLRPGDELLIATPEFPIFRKAATLAGAAVRSVPYTGEHFAFPYEEFRAAAAGERPPRVIAFINPNNPTGTPVDLDYIRDIASAHPDIPVIVDEAYYEFTKVTAAQLTRTHENVIVFRTFSKAFAMAGLRIGYVIARPAVIRELAKIRNPFDVNALAVAAARAQLQAVDEVVARADDIATRVKPRVVDRLTALGTRVVPGAANFVLVQPPDCPAAVTYLRDAGILVRSMPGPALAGMFRASIGTETEMDRFCAVYEEYQKRSM